MAQVEEIQKVKKTGLVRWIFRGVLAKLLIVVLVTFRNPWFNGNLGVVEPGRVYRSAQPTTDLPRLIEHRHLASIVNLRGGTLQDDWYAAEVRTTRDRGIDFYDLPLSATRRPLRRELLILLNLFDHCRYPILIHCKSGSDRTGLATALYLMSRKGAPPEKALRAFSLEYGHIPLLGPEHLHEPFQEYSDWLKANGLVHDPARFRSWVEQVYRSEDNRRDVPALHPGPRRAVLKK